MKRFPSVIGLLISLVMILTSVIPVSSNDNVNAPRIKVKEGTSSNWSGYAVETNLKKPANGVVMYVAGTWTVPAVTSTTASNAYSSVWVGIDGYDSNTVEQIGTDQNWNGTAAVYSAWYEMYPKYPVTIPLAINPGDAITASVSYSGNGNFLLMLNDSTTGGVFTTTQKSASAKRSSAEWIVEAPWSSGVLPLAKFGTVSFTSCSATLNGVPGNINSWANDRIDMVSGSTTKAKTSTTTDGTSFSVTWNHS